MRQPTKSRFDVFSWLDDETHPIWGAVVDVCERTGNGWTEDDYE